jgi:hypothetical protein
VSGDQEGRTNILSPPKPNLEEAEGKSVVDIQTAKGSSWTVFFCWEE